MPKVIIPKPSQNSEVTKIVKLSDIDDRERKSMLINHGYYLEHCLGVSKKRIEYYKKRFTEMRKERNRANKEVKTLKQTVDYFRTPVVIAKQPEEQYPELKSVENSLFSSETFDGLERKLRREQKISDILAVVSISLTGEFVCDNLDVGFMLVCFGCMIVFAVYLCIFRRD